MNLTQKANILLNKIKGKRNHVLVLSSAHKVGSTWIFNVLKYYFDLKRRQIPEKLRKRVTNPWIIDLQKDESIEWLAQLKGKYIIKSHTMLPNNTKQLKNIEFITVMRDPRDLMISSIYYLSNLESEKGGWPWLNSMNFQEMMFEWLKKNKLDYSLQLIQESAPIDSVLNYIIEIGNYDFFNPDNFTITSLLQSGDLKLIDSEETKRELLRLLKVYESIDIMQNNFLQALDDNYFPMLLSRVDMVEFKALEPNFFYGVEIKNYSAFTINETSQHIQRYKSAQIQVDKVLRLIDVELSK